MEQALRIAVLAGAAWALAGLALLAVRARAYGPKSYLAAPAGSAAAGVAYAFGPGMSPTAKESTREHPGAYLTGVGYHLGVFAALACLVLLLADRPPHGAALRVLQLLTLAGAACGAGLLVKRLSVPYLRGISCADDVVANLLTTGFAALAFAATLAPGARAAFLAETTALLLYVPLGKIRHCFFFFPTRYHMGFFYGRRGTFPPGA
ncbi:MAG TPA: hypothetical protein VMS93_05600 [Candidatus Saccharimonadales bacterium]|nr:hypothetical protein [Candidatus Saccharimonadales bacterium]